MSLRVLVEFFIWLVALIHIGFFFLESILWQIPMPILFPLCPKETADCTIPLTDPVVAIFALNQGAYNLAVAIGLVLSSRIIRVLSYETALYLCLSMTLAGIVGGITAKWTIAAFQAAPALIAAALIFAVLRKQDSTP